LFFFVKGENMNYKRREMKGVVVILCAFLLLTAGSVVIFRVVDHRTAVHIHGQRSICKEETGNSMPIMEYDSRTRISKPTGSGPYSTSYVYVDLPRAGRSDIPARIYYPGTGSNVDPAGAPYPGIAFAPGAGGYETSYSSVLHEIASWGFIVAIVGTGGPCNQEVVDTQSDVINYLEIENSDPPSRFYNKIDISKFGASGHSNGGWAAIGGAVADIRYKGVCTIFGAAGPNFGNGQANTRDLHVPLQLMAGSQDNTFLPSSTAYYNAANPVRSFLILQGSGHGGPIHLEYMISFFKFWLSEEFEYHTFIYGEDIMEDIDNGVLEFQYDLGLVAELGASKAELDEDEEVEFTGTCTIIEPTGPGRTVVSYEWDLDGDGDYEHSTPEPVSSHIYSESGTHHPVLRCTDSWHLTAISEPFAIGVSNPAPTANAGADQTVNEDDPVTFNGTLSIDTPSDLPLLSFRWDFGDGDGSGWSARPIATHVYEMSDRYGVTLEVKDDDGATHMDGMHVEVKNVEPGCKILYGNISGVEDVSISFHGEGFDTESDLDDLEYNWDFGDGGYTPWQNQPVARHTYTQAGEYTAVLMVRDEDLDIGCSNVSVNIENVIPKCDLALFNPEAKEDKQVGFSASGEDSVSDIDDLLFRLDYGDGNSTDWQSGEMFYHIYNNSGIYNVVLTVMDNSNDTCNITEYITIYNEAPTALFSFYPSREIEENTSVKFTADGSSDTPSDIDDLNYTWKFGNEGTAHGSTVNHTFQGSGKHKVELALRDDDGDIDILQKNVNVVNVPPTAFFTLTGELTIGQKIKLNASGSSDTPGDLPDLEYRWTVGYKKLEGKVVEFQPVREGRTVITLVVTDDDGDSDEFKSTVNVLPLEKEEGDDDGSARGVLENRMVIPVIAIVVLGGAALLVVVLLKRKRKGKLDLPDEGQGEQNPVDDGCMGMGEAVEDRLEGGVGTLYSEEGYPPPRAQPGKPRVPDEIKIVERNPSVEKKLLLPPPPGKKRKLPPPPK